MTWQLTWHGKNSGAMWRRMRTPRVTQYICAHVWARVCTCVHVCMNNEITPFSRFSLSHYIHTTDILV